MSDLAVRADDGEVLFTFPTQGTPHEWRLRRRQVEEWQGLYPGLDVMDECRRAYAWVTAAPTHRKTARGMCTFLVNWCNRSVRQGGGRVQPAAAPVVQDWYEECGRLHAHACGLSQYQHAIRLQMDAAREAFTGTKRTGRSIGT